jgi:hypothetical protein
MTRTSLTLLGVCLFFFIASIHADSENYKMTSTPNFTLEVDYDSSLKGVPTYDFSANDSYINTLELVSVYEVDGDGTVSNSTIDFSSITFTYPSSSSVKVDTPFNISTGLFNTSGNTNTNNNTFLSLVFSHEVYQDQSYAHMEIFLTNYTFASADAQLVFMFKFHGNNVSALSQNDTVVTNGPAFFTIGANNIKNATTELLAGGDDAQEMVVLQFDHFTNTTWVQKLYFGIGNGTVDGAGVGQPKKGLKAGYIVLIVAVVLIVVSAAVAAAVIFIRKRKRYEYV